MNPSAVDLNHQPESNHANVVVSQIASLITATTATNDRAGNPVCVHQFSTKLGPMVVAASKEGLCLLEFIDRRMLFAEFNDLKRKLNASFRYEINKFVAQAQQEILEYLAGERDRFTVRLHLTGSDFQRKVWNELLRIPYGETRSYGQQALTMGHPRAIRAVANAIGMNKMAIIIPCHRVIGRDGRLTGYAAGLERKKALLDIESRNRH